MAVLTLDRISKSFGNFSAVRELSFDIQPGQIYGLLGPNGAGKTTTIRMIMDIIMPDEGQIRIFDQPNSMKILSRVGYLPEERGLYQKMKIHDVLKFFGELKGMNKAKLSEEIPRWLETFELTDWRNKKVESLSRGMQQKLQFIATILHRPSLIILDEPFTGLDPINTALVKDVILELQAEGATIIFSTHLMEQVEKLCDSICLINKGRRVLHGELRDIKRRYGRDRIQMEYSGNSDFLKTTGLVDQLDDYGNYVEIRLASDANPQDLLKAVSSEADIFRFEIVEPSLNEIFIEVVKKEGGEPVGGGHV